MSAPTASQLASVEVVPETTVPQRRSRRRPANGDETVQIVKETPVPAKPAAKPVAPSSVPSRKGKQAAPQVKTVQATSFFGMDKPRAQLKLDETTHLVVPAVEGDAPRPPLPNAPVLGWGGKAEYRSGGLKGAPHWGSDSTASALAQAKATVGWPLRVHKAWEFYAEELACKALAKNVEARMAHEGAAMRRDIRDQVKPRARRGAGGRRATAGQEEGEWAQMREDAKQAYNVKYDADVVRYRRELAAFWVANPELIAARNESKEARNLSKVRAKADARAVNLQLKAAKSKRKSGRKAKKTKVQEDGNNKADEEEHEDTSSSEGEGEELGSDVHDGSDSEDQWPSDSDDESEEEVTVAPPKRGPGRAIVRQAPTPAVVSAAAKKPPSRAAPASALPAPLPVPTAKGKAAEPAPHKRGRTQQDSAVEAEAAPAPAAASKPAGRKAAPAPKQKGSKRQQTEEVEEEQEAVIVVAKPVGRKTANKQAAASAPADRVVVQVASPVRPTKKQRGKQ